MNSMTGYAFKESVIDDTQISVEIKSVNSKYLDLNIVLPSFLNQLEAELRKIVTEKIARGKVDIIIRIGKTNLNSTVSVDTNTAETFKNAIYKLANAIGRKEDEISTDLLVSLIINKEGVLNVTNKYDIESYRAKIAAVFNEVFDSFVEDRKREGENLKKDLLFQLDILDRCEDFFKSHQAEIESKFRALITEKFKEIVGTQIDENRIMNEVASMIVKYTINEEIIRLESHLQALRKEITENPVPGKRIDFICQEANREINTIGSKNQLTESGAIVINAKDALENIREQAKNVE